MKKSLLVVIFFYLTTNSQNNQTLQNSIVFGAENTANSIEKTFIDEDNNIYAAGSFVFFSNFIDNTQNNPTFSEGAADSFIAKYDKELDLLWSTKIGGIEDDNIVDITKNSNGDIIATGYYSNQITVNNTTYNVSVSGKQEFFITCLDHTNGNIKWFKNFSNSYSEYGDVSESSRVNLIDTNKILLTLNTSVDNKYHLKLIIIDNDGNIQIEKAITGLDYSAFRNTKIDNQSNIYLSGFFSGTNVDFDLGNLENIQNSGNKNNAIVVKYNSSFELQWLLNFENNDAEVGDCFDLEINEKLEEIYISLVHGGVTNINPNGNEVLISPYKTNNTGAILIYDTNGILKKTYNQTGNGFNLGKGFIYDINLNKQKDIISFTGIAYDNLPNMDFTGKINIAKNNNNFYSIIYGFDAGELKPIEYLQYNIPKTANIGLRAFASVNDENKIILSGVAQDGDILYNNNHFQNGTFGTISSYITSFESLTLSLAANYDTMNVDIMPNPVNNSFTISSLENYSRCFIYDINGKFIFKSNSKRVNVDFLKRGVYFIKIYTEKGVYRKKIIKN